jgi:hypothetical protein
MVSIGVYDNKTSNQTNRLESFFDDFGIKIKIIAAKK